MLLATVAGECMPALRGCQPPFLGMSNLREAGLTLNFLLAAHTRLCQGSRVAQYSDTTRSSSLDTSSPWSIARVVGVSLYHCSLEPVARWFCEAAQDMCYAAKPVH